ncbi:hypothetical protein PGT21_003028 [Puccinia graminis f. sp. tritici]|uniref:E2 ubiquitin-conjugating enzyme n=1 Tax=Puccinia graminis f. sp. tritici TaxID=56615 RepID=A0A5B0MVE1_PUCGR|nr:hypothetical protein PGTUg99_015749 [Puccinia graminis f. sp. tritici]KAA1103864.1 hypothetical protein PGT21_003028 [Puccinia graminis f. sp. tritici]
MADSLSSKSLRRINKELNSLRAQPPEGIRVLINEDDITDLKAWIHGPAETPYHNGYFKISIRFGPEYPSAPPNCIFATKIFHPNVGPKGEICVNTLKKDWSSNQTLTDILTVVKCLLIYPNPESALDEEAGRLLLENYDEYHHRAKLWTDIHAKNKPAGLFEPDQSTNTSESIPTTTTTTTTATDPKPMMQPFASSNQVNNKQARLGGTATTGTTTTTATTTATTAVLKSQQSDADDERVMKANSLLPATTNTAHPIDGENLIPSPLSNHPKQPYPIPTTTSTTAAATATAAANLKDKDRRGRKRL